MLDWIYSIDVFLLNAIQTHLHNSILDPIFSVITHLGGCRYFMDPFGRLAALQQKIPESRLCYADSLSGRRDFCQPDCQTHRRKAPSFCGVFRAGTDHLCSIRIFFPFRALSCFLYRCGDTGLGEPQMGASRLSYGIFNCFFKALPLCPLLF